MSTSGTGRPNMSRLTGGALVDIQDLRRKITSFILGASPKLLQATTHLFRVPRHVCFFGYEIG
jgi:hypothetical protein